MTKYLRSKKKITYRLIYVIGIFGSLLFSQHLYTKYDPKEYSGILNLYVSLFFLVFAIICIYGFLSVKNYYIYKDKFILKSFLGTVSKSFDFTEIDFWTVKQKKDKYNQWEVLTLHTKKGEKTKISSYFYENYHEIKIGLIKNQTRNLKLEELELNKEDLRYAVGIAFFGLIFLFCAYKCIETKEIQPSDIIVFGDKISKNIEIIRGSKNSKSLLLKLNHYPEFDFKISGGTFRKMYAQDLIENVREGDSVFIGIKKTEFRKKLAKQDSLTLVDKYFHYKIIHIESLSAQNEEYLTLSENNKGKSTNKYLGFVFFGLIGSVLFFASMLMLKRKLYTNIDSYKSRNYQQR